MERKYYLSASRSLETAETFGDESNQLPKEAAGNFERDAWVGFLKHEDISAGRAEYGHRNQGQAVGEVIKAARSEGQKKVIIDAGDISPEKLATLTQSF